jgi:hypothetical protein
MIAVPGQAVGFRIVFHICEWWKVCQDHSRFYTDFAIRVDDEIIIDFVGAQTHLVRLEHCEQMFLGGFGTLPDGVCVLADYAHDARPFRVAK